jgi:hypothetical protein
VAWPAKDHEKAAEVARDVDRGTVVVSKFALLWSWLAAPTCIAAAAAAIGITSTPVIVVIAPFIASLSGAASAALELFSKWKNRKGGKV